MTATAVPDEATNIPLDETPKERARAGKDARRRAPRSASADWEPAPDRPDPVDLLRQQAKSRVPELVPIRHGRMAASAFAFFRGAAAVMAADLGAAPHSALEVQLCGDAHLSNFGGFASPERSLVFDANDFDETLPGPFEWDVKRLVASIEIAGRSLGFDDAMRTRIVQGAVRTYRESIRSFGSLGNLDIWYLRLDPTSIVGEWGDEVGDAAMARFRKTIDKAGSKDRLKAKAKLTRVVDGELRFISDPPLLVPAHELFPDEAHHKLVTQITGALDEYRHSLSGDHRQLFERYRFVDLARKVVGVGSVGTRAWVVLLVGRDDDDPLFLQVKEAEASVLEPHLRPSVFAEHGQRVVEGQKLVQAASDIFLGWHRVVEGVDGRRHDYYVRQLWDWKASADLTTMDPPMLGIYSQMCAWVLARGHARSGDPCAIGAYLGSNRTFDEAMSRFAVRYADQNERDHQRLLDEIAAGRLEAESGI